MPASTTVQSQSPNHVLVCAAAWIVPDLGHLWLGRRKGLIFLVVLPLMFAFGLALRGRIFPVEISQPLVALAAFANAGLFAAYIVLAHRVASSGAGVDGLAAAMIVALVFVTPLAGWAALPAFTDPVAIAAGIGVGISSSVIPYIADQVAMKRLSRAARLVRGPRLHGS